MKRRAYLMNPDFSLRTQGKTISLVYRSAKEASSLNETACKVLKCADGKKTKDEIVAAVLTEYDGNKRQITASVHAFLKELVRNRVLLEGDYQEENKCFLAADICLPGGKPFIPQGVCFGVTGKCNLRCKHCLARDTWEADDIPTAEMIELIDQMGSAGVSEVNIFGGEPLVRKDLFLLLARLNKYPISLTMNTNATLMTPETVSTLVDKFKVKGFTVSLDGTKEVHELQRGMGTYDKTVRGIEHILRGGGSALLSFTVTKLNIGDLEKTAALGKELGMNQVRFNHVFYEGNATCYLQDVHVSSRDEIDAVRRVFELSRKYPGFITGSYLQQYEKMLDLGKVKAEPRFVRVPPCGAGTNKCAIRPDGWVTPCEIVWSVKAGNIRKQKFIDIWNNAAVMKTFRRTIYVHVAELSGCANCEYQFMCFRGHRCTPYYYPGGIQNRSLYCWKEKQTKG